jgi:hypothetical protein
MSRIEEEEPNLSIQLRPLRSRIPRLSQILSTDGGSSHRSLAARTARDEQDSSRCARPSVLPDQEWQSKHLNMPSLMSKIPRCRLQISRSGSRESRRSPIERAKGSNLEKSGSCFHGTTIQTQINNLTFNGTISKLTVQVTDKAKPNQYTARCRAWQYCRCSN